MPVFLLASVALAASTSTCPWPDVQSVTATTREVVINGKAVPVQGRDAWRAVQADLQVCDREYAAQLLGRWRKNMRWTNFLAPGCIALSPFTLGVSLAAPIGTALTATNRRDALVSELLRE